MGRSNKYLNPIYQKLFPKKYPMCLLGFQNIPIFIENKKNIDLYDLNLNNFVIYRNLTDGKFLTLDVPKNDPQISEIDFTGIIVPEYASPKLKANANEIVAKLKSDGILTED